MSHPRTLQRLMRQIGIGLGFSMLACSALAQSASYPSRPVKVFVPSAPGTGIDVVVRMMNEALSKNLGQPFVVETRPGAASTIAAAGVLAQPADGYTLLSDSSSHTIVPSLMPSLSYDTARDFSGVTTLIENPLMMVASRASGIRNVADLIAAGKAKAGAMNYASAGVGSTTHISAEKFRIGAGLSGVHIPFKSSTDALVEVMAGRIDFTYTALASAQAGIADGKLVALAMGSRRVAGLNVPSIAEIVPNAGYSTWLGIMVSSKTPRDLVTRLNREIVRAMHSPEVKEKLAKVGSEPWTMTTEEFDALRRRELVENERLIKTAGIKM